MISLQQFFPLLGGVQHYAWGSLAHPHKLPYIARLLHQPDLNEPWAELWLGTHPKLCSEIILPDGKKKTLQEFIDQNPLEILGGKKNTQKTQTLPFLLKILSCEKPLSIQCHPDLKTAALLHTEDPENYPDSNHKPETIIALTTFKAMAGFREFSEILKDLKRHPACSCWLEKVSNPQTLQSLCEALFQLTQEEINSILTGITADPMISKADQLFQYLLPFYPKDRGTLFAFLLQYITLEPGESLFIKANQPHAYIKGTGIECMANSDNVIRAGLTPKKIDVKNLLKTADFNSQDALQKSSGIHPTNSNNHLYLPPIAEYRVTTITQSSFDLSQREKENEPAFPGILLILEGSFTLQLPNQPAVKAKTGSAWFRPAALKQGIIIPETKESFAVWAEPNF